MHFFLGTHETSWLGRLDVPLFVSHRRLAKRVRLPIARAAWALDSGGFTQLDKAPHRYTMSVSEYIEAVERYAIEIGQLQWAAPMDWMCEPHILAKTGLSVREHQERTVANYLELRGRGPFIPVLQGWGEEDYHACIDLYASAGVDLTTEPLVGLGTVCRRQGSEEIRRTVGSVAARGLCLHGFGVKKLGLPAIAHVVVSADSMAWSTRGRREWQHERRQLCREGSTHAGSCANCSAWAVQWRDQVIDRLGLFGITGGP